jgi:hypothetical protein
MRVQDLMLPLEKYTVVSEEATLTEVFFALEGALKGSQKADPTEARDFAVHVLDKDRRVVGRLVVWDVLQGLEAQALRRVDPLSMVEGYAAWDRPLAQLTSKAENVRAQHLVRALHKDEYIDEDAGLNEALRRLVDNRFLSLIATRGRETVGILRVVDVFKYVCDELRSALRDCECDSAMGPRQPPG